MSLKADQNKTFGINTNILNKFSAFNNEYINKSPFPYIIIDNLFEDNVLNEVIKEFDDTSRWSRKKPKSKKLWKNNLGSMAPDTQKFLKALNGADFRGKLSDLTSVQDIMADHSYFGGGLHCNIKGSRLNVHVDFNRHKGMFRRVNMLIYLNHNWKEEWAGNLELWHASGMGSKATLTERAESILPAFNRTVIFNTGEYSFHGHPYELNCPENIKRKSIALYYYTKTIPKEEKAPQHSTIYKRIPSK